MDPAHPATTVGANKGWDGSWLIQAQLVACEDAHMECGMDMDTPPTVTSDRPAELEQ